MTIRDMVAGYRHSVLAVEILTEDYDLLTEIRPSFDDPGDEELMIFDHFADLEIQSWCFGCHGQIMFFVNNSDGLQCWRTLKGGTK